LEKVEIFALLPIGRVFACILDAVLLQSAREAAGLVALELEEIIDEYVAELLAEQWLSLERVERFWKAFRQHGAVGSVGFVALRARVARMLDAVEARDDLRRRIEVGIGGGLAHPVLEPGRRVGR